MQRGRIWGTCLYQGPWVKFFGVPRRGTYLKPKSGFYLLIPIIALSNGYIRHTDAGKQRKLLVTRAIREVISETYVIL